MRMDSIFTQHIIYLITQCTAVQGAALEENNCILESGRGREEEREEERVRGKEGGREGEGREGGRERGREGGREI